MFSSDLYLMALLRTNSFAFDTDQAQLARSSSSVLSQIQQEWGDASATASSRTPRDLVQLNLRKRAAARNRATCEDVIDRIFSGRLGEASCPHAPPEGREKAGAVAAGGGCTSSAAVFVEIGPGSGFALKRVLAKPEAQRPRKLVAVEISPRFRMELESEFPALGNDWSSIELRGGAEDEHAASLGFLPSGTVDTLLACHVVYFLQDPLDPCVAEWCRVLKPGGSVVLVCKWHTARGKPKDVYLHQSSGPVIAALERGGLSVALFPVEELGNPAHHYVAIVASRPADGAKPTPRHRQSDVPLASVVAMKPSQ